MSKILLGKDNFIPIVFTDVDLTAFDRVEAIFGSDARDSVANPASVVVHSATELRLFFGDTTETGGHYWIINGYDTQNPNGYELTSKCLGNLAPSTVC
jgi:hypothetical protein